MQRGVLPGAASSAFARGDRLEAYRLIVVGIMDRQGLCTSDLARAIGSDRSHLGKVRRGLRPISGDMLDALIGHLSLDRHRLSLAVEVIGSTDIYFDPAFRNICHYVETVVGNLMMILKEPGTVDRTMMFAALSKPGCEILANTTVRHLDERFARLAMIADHNPPRDAI